MSKDGIDLVLRLTEVDPNRRPDARESLCHHWFGLNHVAMSPTREPASPSRTVPVESPLMSRINETGLSPGDMRKT